MQTEKRGVEPDAELEMYLREVGTSPVHDDMGWKSALQSPTDRLSTLYNLSKFTDLTITFPGHHDILKVHRLVLAMSTPVFECMLFGPMAVGEELKLLEDPPEAFKWLMQYIYCGTTNLPKVSIAVQVYHLASKYQMKDLATICSMYLRTNINGNNLPFIYDTASLLEDAALQNACSKIVSSSADSLFSSSDIGQLSLETMKHLLQQELKVKSEVSIFKGLVKWGESQESQTAEPKSVRQVIEELLSYIRFLTMTTGEFIKHVMPSNILTLEECSAILMNMNKVQNVHLSDAFSRDVKRRSLFDWADIHNIKLYDYFAQIYSGLCTTHQHISRGERGNTRQNFITDMKLSKEIYLGRIILSYQDFPIGNWKVEVTDSAKSVLGVARTNHLQNTDNTQMNATFTPPVLMKPDAKYDICFIGYQLHQNIQKDISIRDRKMDITGCLLRQIGIDIQFWSFDD